MKISEINKLEKDNTTKCYLVKDGIFWRAYEKSAYWFVNNLKPYTITKKHFKGLNVDVAYLGFPGSVLEEVLGVAENKGCIIEKHEKTVTIGGCKLSDDFDEWKNKIPYQTPDDTEKQRASEPAENYKSPEGLAAPRNEGIATLALEKIKAFPVAERTPIQCQQFIVELQNTINGKL